ncbi:MAG: 3'(2'),5'-bisphosphate nucleotidase CysQ, partial [Bdellovibrionales bacterium]|nr:3'(2'),5'-bisphosphate nucleotidase CysQ [Bdellovibrionales bacterium]
MIEQILDLEASLHKREATVARNASIEAGQLLQELFESRQYEVINPESKHPVTTADLRANEIILNALRQHFPADSILSEESDAKKDALKHGHRLWVIDPLDGTREFVSNSTDYCVMIGLLEGNSPIVGAIYHPATQTSYLGVVGVGTWISCPSKKNTEAITPPTFATVEDKLRLVHSKNHRNHRLEHFFSRFPNLTCITMGSAGLKSMMVLENKADFYFHPSPHIKEWDTCAAHAIIQAAGGWMSDGKGDELKYRQTDP